ncbi:MAG: xanthine dehydrogenase family protein molybdopterin-binding subunit [Treponema sp.]|nr:xanthine dehydrogenase family protein molybdopterin-binding subunit [Treponema sp.]
MGDTLQFVDDIEIPGALYGLTIRSPIPKGRLNSVECPPLPDGYTLIRSGDIPGKNQLTGLNVPVLAAEAVSYIGEPVALLFGPDRQILESLGEQCRVITEPGTPVFGLEEASLEEDNIIARRNITIGDADKAFSDGAKIIEGTYRTEIQEHLYSEPLGAQVELMANSSMKGKIIVHTATQWPFQVRRSVAEVLGIAPNLVVVKPSCIGVHLDGKIWYPSVIACHAALGAFITRKPVKLMLSRYEDFLYSPKRNQSAIQLRSALGEKGQLLATEINIRVNMGAYRAFADEILDQCCLGAAGSFKQGNIKINAVALGTNLPPAGPFAGFGMSQGFFAAERHAALIIDTLRLDPLEWRKENTLNQKKPLAIGASLGNPFFPQKMLDTAAAMGDYYRKWASYENLRIYRRNHGGADKHEPLRGIGIAMGYQNTGLFNVGTDKGLYSVELTLGKDGTLDIRTSAISSNNEYIAIWKTITAEILAIEPANIRVLSGTTDTAPDSGPAVSSRNVTAVTRLVELAAGAIRKQRFRAPLPITVRRSSKPVRVPSWKVPSRPPGDLAERNTAVAAPDTLEPSAPISIDQNALLHAGWGVSVVEVEIDPMEFIPRIRGVWMGIDGGKILSQRQAWRAVRFSVIQALGWASQEKLFYQEGCIPDRQFTAYDLPNPQDIPPINVDFIWNDTAPPKGIGEVAFNCVPAAYVQAVSQAVDHPFTELPLIPQDVWDAGRPKNAERVLP